VCVARSAVRIVDGDSVNRIWITDGLGNSLEVHRWRAVLTELVKAMAALGGEGATKRKVPGRLSNSFEPIGASCDMTARSTRPARGAT
jgi:hypothetical protein